MKHALEETKCEKEHDNQPSLKKRKLITNVAEYQSKTAIKWENLPPNDMFDTDFDCGVYNKPILNHDYPVVFKTHNNSKKNEYLSEENLYRFMKTKISKIQNDMNGNTNPSKLQFHKAQYYTYLLHPNPENVDEQMLSFPVLKYNEIICQHQGEVVGTEFCSKYDCGYLRNCDVKLAVNMDVMAHIFDFLAGDIKMSVWRILKDNSDMEWPDFTFEMRQIICDFGDFGIVVGSELSTPIIKSLGGIDFCFDDCHDPVIFGEIWPVQNVTQVLELCLKWINKYLVLREPC
eukprot:410285_1